MSSARQVRILPAGSLRVPGEGSSTQGKSGPKARSKDVTDGQQVEIPVPRYNRTVGTREGNMSRKWKVRYKRGSRTAGKSAVHETKP